MSHDDATAPNTAATDTPTPSNAAIASPVPVPPVYAPPAAGRASRLALRHLTDGILPRLPILISVISIGLSLYTFFAVRSTPDMHIILPQQVRIAQSQAHGVWLYLEPALLHSGPSEQVDAVLNVTLTVTPQNPAGPPETLVWDESGAWVYDAATQELNWQYTDDPGPFLIGPRNAVQVTLLFNSPHGWRIPPGDHQLTLAVTRMANQASLTATADFRIDAAAVEYLEESQGTRFLAFPIFPSP